MDSKRTTAYKFRAWREKDDLKPAYRTVIDAIGALLRNNKEDIHFCGPMGSLTEDIDITVILREVPDDPANFTRYTNLIAQFRTLQEALLTNNIRMAVFPCFRLEMFVEDYNDGISTDTDNVYVHLLVYPSLPTFLAWESDLLGYVILDITDPFWPTDIDLDAVRQRITLKAIPDRLSPYLSLLYESYRFMAGSQLPEPLRRREALHKLRYVLRFAIFEVYYADAYLRGDIPFPDKAAIRSAPADGNDMIKILRELDRFGKDDPPPVSALSDLYRDAAQSLSDLLKT